MPSTGFDSLCQLRLDRKMSFVRDGFTYERTPTGMRHQRFRHHRVQEAFFARNCRAVLAWVITLSVCSVRYRSWTVVLLGLAVIVAGGTGCAVTARDTGRSDVSNPSPSVPVDGNVGSGFNGSFIGIEVGGAVSALEWARANDNIGGGGFVSGRLSLVLYLLDIGLSYRIVRYGLSDVSISGNLDRHIWVGSFKLHPLFATLVRGSLLDHILASTYVELGLGAEYALWEPAESVGSADGGGFVMELGAGFDVPIGLPDGGDSFWLGLGYKKSWVTVDIGQAPDLDDWDEHIFFLRVGYRIHGVDIARIPRPTEMQFR